MNPVRAFPFCLALAVSIIWGGCGAKPTPPPKPLAIEEAPKSLADTFKKASAQAKQLADDATGALGAKDYAKALLALQSLQGRSDLTPEQRDMATRAMLAVSKALEEQAGSGNQEAQKVLDFRRSSK